MCNLKNEIQCVVALNVAESTKKRENTRRNFKIAFMIDYNPSHK